MATLSEIDYAIRYNLHEALYDPVDVLLRINTAVSRIAAGIKLPDGRVSPPLPDLYSTGTVATGSGVPMASLPSTYQRNLFNVVDSDRYVVPAPIGGDYYSFQMFTRRINYPDMTETGKVTIACVKGSNLYYQAIPTVSVNLSIYFYRKPVAMADQDDEPDGLPEPFQIDLIKNWVLAEIYGDHMGYEDSTKKGADKFPDKRSFHLERFWSFTDDMMQFVGEDEGQPTHYHFEDYSWL